jgi:hypothetical protein
VFAAGSGLPEKLPGAGQLFDSAVCEHYTAATLRCTGYLAGIAQAMEIGTPTSPEGDLGRC